ncbi:MAG: translation initiation factor IF-2 [Desulfobacterales bacterium]|nr:MAG: translation initiation factor IF-2 [Desulfobacterales bacterium]
MAKVRVYELAKDLNMTNKQLLNKMKELKIQVKSHMSSLEDDAVKTIKHSIFGKKTQQNDVKVKPSVIRRRKAKPAAPEASPADETPVEPENVIDTVVASSDVPKVVKDASLGDGEQAKATVKEEKKAPAPQPVVKKKKKVRVSEPAKIIRPVKVEAEPEPVSEPVQEKEQVTSVTEEKVSPVEAQPVAVEDTSVSEPDKEEPSKPAAKPEIKVEESVASDMTAEQNTVGAKADAAADTEEKATAKKKKKKSKSTPAKIVRVVDPAVLENIRRTRPGASEDKKGAPGKSSGHQRVAASGQNQSASLGGIGVPTPTSGDPRQRNWGPDLPPADSIGKKKRRKKKAVVERDDIYRGRSRKKRGKKEAKGKKGTFQKTQITTPKAIKRRIKIDDAIELAELAKRMGIKAHEMIAKLMGMGVMATVNQTIDFDTAALVASEFNFEVEKASFEEEALLNVAEAEVDEGHMEECPPVVTIMGHVDHGKTSLLDVIRESKITSGEAGGITQHIGAYNVETPNGGRITFLDTPGHAAFTAMRSRGAKITDIVILVVAADDGVMPQTIEAINHAKAADVPVVVAVNKMDKAGADPDRIMRELSEHDLLAEEWGGSVIFVKVSAKTGQGIDELLEMVLLQAEVLELRANPDRKATGYVVESRLDTGRGSVATVLVKQGTLKDGDPIVCGLHSGRIRAMIDDTGSRIKEAGPSMPVEIVGMTGVPDAGDEFIAVASDKDAKQIAGHRMQKQRAKELAKKSRANLEKMFENLGSAEVKELKLIVKADVQGSIEALNDSLKELAKEEVDVKIVHSGAGTITESDVALAAVSDAIIIGFNVRPNPQIRKQAKDENVDMRFYNIIYDVINDIKTALDGMMPSTFHEIIIGRAEVRDTFVVPKIGTIAGCAVTDGKMVRGKNVRLLRDGVIKCDTDISSLRRFKDDVKEVDSGFECGIGLEKYNDIKVGDAIECYEVEERKYQG